MNERACVVLDHVSFFYYDEADPERGEVMSEEREEGGVKDVSLTVAPGSCVVLCGRSGEGKSTVLRLIDGLAGTFFPGERQGVVLVDGEDVFELSARKRTETMGVVMQDPRSQFFMGTVADEIAFSAENLGVNPKEIITRVQDASALCGIEELLCEQLTQLSSGQKQRVALASAIASRPQVLILDEPTSNLDAQGSSALIEVLTKVKHEGAAIIVSEHRLHQFISLADEYAYVRGGTIALRWSREEFAKIGVSEAECLGLRHPDMGCVPRFERRVLKDTRRSSFVWRAEGVSYRYPATKRGLTRFAASFPSGQVTVIVGANGAGKTTLGKILVGLIREREGSITRNGRPLSRRERRRRSYFVMQDADYQLYAGSVAEEIVFGREAGGGLHKRAQQALKAFDLVGLATRHPASLSGGQKQRVTLAAAYCSDAELVVLDEPTSGLDGCGMREVASWCRRLAEEGKAVVVITHDVLLSKLAGDYVVNIDNHSTATDEE